MKDIKKGSIIKGNNWSEPVKVELIECVGDYVRIVGETALSRKHIDDVIPKHEFSELLIEEVESDFSEDPEKVFLALEAKRYRFASIYDPLLAMNTSKIDPLPHQIEGVYGYVLKLPRIRFLIADDPGAGKTIMAGLIIKELKLRNLLNRILIVAPGHLKDQWRRELKEKFEEKFVVIGRGMMDAHYGENVWLRESQIITSIDFAKRDDIIPSLTAAHFDLIIVDEAHKMSAYLYGEKKEKTGRYKLGEVLSRISEHLLFLTATPHKGDTENFRLFIDLLEPGFFATTDMLNDSIKNKDNPLFIRRVKEDLKDFDGKPLFLPRYVKTVTFNLKYNSPNEQDLYNKLSKYVNTQYNKALAKDDKKRNVAFALVILQRRFASSTYALLRSLERRKKRLEELLQGAENKECKEEGDNFDFESVEDLSEEDRWKEEEIWEALSVAENREELKNEISIIDGLIEQAKDIIKNEEEIKLKELKKSLEDLREKYSDKKDKKIIIFTESRDTLDYLEKKINDWGYKVNTIHGGMQIDDRINAENIFKNETEVMVATEAAGEGINLQFCHLMINYDIPWNPNRLEQRMGRIHRYGQQKEVYVFNLVAEDTREGRVLNKLFEKLKEISDALGSDKVFDVLSEVLYNKKLSQLLIDAAANARNIDDILKDIDIRVDEDYIEKVKENLGESLATQYIDYTRIKEIQQRARECRLIPEYTESFFKKAFKKAGGNIRERADGFLALESVPYDIRKIAEQNNIKKSYGEILNKYPKITFDKDVAFKNPDAEFVSFGHPLFESVMLWIENNFIDSLLKGAVFIDPDCNLNGFILFYECEIKDGTGNIVGKSLFSCYVSHGKVKSISPEIIWDLEDGKIGFGDNIDLEGAKNIASGNILSKLQEYRGELLKERQRQTEIKKKYGIKSLDYLIGKLVDDLISLEDRKERGENVDLVIRNKEERKEEYVKASNELKKRIKSEKNLTMSTPRFIGVIKVIPSERVNKAMQTDDKIEKIGMDFAMKYELKNERTPTDVSLENRGFDIRSIDKNKNLRYIEVKARAETGPVALTQNEWFKAKRFKEDYYLYVVMNAGSNPKLYVIQNPAENLKPEEMVEVVRYVIPFNEVAEKGENNDIQIQKK